MKMSLLNNRIFNHSLGSQFLKVIKFQNSLTKQVRFAHRSVNIKKPISHWRRDLVKLVTKPKYVKRYNILPIDELCTKALIHKDKLENEDVIHPYLRILGDEIFDELKKANLVVILQQYSHQKDDFQDFCIDLHGIQLKFLYHTMKSISVALKGTELEPLLKLYEAYSVTFVSQEAKFSKLLKIIKKYPFMTLLGGVYEARIISITDFQTLSANHFIESYQSQLSSVLASSGQRLVGNLSRHQQELCSSLQRYVDDQTKKKSTEE